MRQARRFAAGAAWLLLTLAAAGDAGAATATGNVAVSMTITAECKLQAANPLAFGTRGLLDTVTDASTTLDIICTNTTPYSVSLNAGGGTGATVSSRRMTGGATQISYVLYRDSGRTQVWGETINTDTYSGTGSGATQSVTIYGRVPVQSTPTPGAYADTVQVTVTY